MAKSLRDPAEVQAKWRGFPRTPAEDLLLSAMDKEIKLLERTLNETKAELAALIIERRIIMNRVRQRYASKAKANGRARPNG